MMTCKARTRSGSQCKNQAVPGADYCKLHQEEASERVSTGQSFETNVLEVLKLLGYRVERNVTINGCQIDIYAEFKTGLIVHRVMVECKELREGKPVGKDEVKEFGGVLAVARGRAVDKGLMVTTNGFTREARQFAYDAGIDLFTLSELSTQLVDFDQYLDRLIQEIERLPSFSYYVPLSGTDTEAFEDLDRSTFHRPLEDYVSRYFFEQGGTRLALLGNFGTGKTTFCHRYAYELAKSYRKDDRSSKIPVVVSLSEYESRLDIQQLVANTLQYGFGVRALDLSLCLELQRLGRFVLIFDGFDEMATRVDPDVIRENLRELEKIARYPETKMIVTCRTHFFRDRVQVEVLDNFEVVYIPEWGELELREYLQKRFGPTWRKQLEHIQGTHNLAELAQTPLFVEMIVETLPKLGDEVRRVELYREYTDTWIRRQSKRRGARFTSEERQTLVTELALKLYQENKHSCHYSEFARIIKTTVPTDDAAQIDYLRSDVQTCTFLTRDSNGNYGFKHKSFMEFFVAQAISADLKNGSASLLGARVLPLEIRRFVVELLHGTSPPPLLLNAVSDPTHQLLRDNALALLTDLRVDISHVKLADDPALDRNTHLVTQFLQGEVRAFEALMTQYLPDLRKYTVAELRDTDLADEVVTDSFLEMWEKRDHLSSANEFKRYLFVIAKRRALDAIRRQRRESISYGLAVDFDQFSFDLSSERQIELIDERGVLHSAIQALPAQLQLVVKLRYLEGLSNAEVAKTLNLSPSSVSALNRRALKALRDALIAGRSAL